MSQNVNIVPPKIVNCRIPIVPCVGSKLHILGDGIKSKEKCWTFLGGENVNPDGPPSLLLEVTVNYPIRNEPTLLSGLVSDWPITQ